MCSDRTVHGKHVCSHILGNCVWEGGEEGGKEKDRGERKRNKIDQVHVHVYVHVSTCR